MSKLSAFGCSGGLRLPLSTLDRFRMFSKIEPQYRARHWAIATIAVLIGYILGAITIALICVGRNDISSSSEADVGYMTIGYLIYSLVLGTFTIIPGFIGWWLITDRGRNSITNAILLGLTSISPTLLTLTLAGVLEPPAALGILAVGALASGLIWRIANRRVSASGPSQYSYVSKGKNGNLAKFMFALFLLSLCPLPLFYVFFENIFPDPAEPTERSSAKPVATRDNVGSKIDPWREQMVSSNTIQHPTLHKLEKVIPTEDPGASVTTQSSPKRFGAIAYGQINGGTGVSSGYPTKVAAEKAAMSSCMNIGHDCRPRVSFENQCGAAATDFSGSTGPAGVYSGVGPDEAVAGSAALEACADDGHDECKVITSRCSWR